MANSQLEVDEKSRLEALFRYEILDTPAEALFDDFTQLAAEFCEAPISLISLIDDQRQWFKSTVGLEVDETPRELAFCAHAIAEPDEVLIVPNATEDQRFADNLLVTSEPHIRFYAGAPLVTPDGHVLGTLCVIDRRPRTLSEQQINTLKMLARQVVSQLEARHNLQRLERTARDLEHQRQEMQLILDHVPAYIFFKDTENNILRVNRAVADVLGVESSRIEGRSTAEIYPDHAEAFHQDDLEVIRAKKPKLGVVERLAADREGLRWIRTDKIPIANELGEIERLLILALDITDLKNTEDSLRESKSLLRKANEHLEDRVLRKTAELAASTARLDDLYQNAPDMHVSVNPETSCIVQCNQTLLNETGYTLDEIIGYPVDKIHHADSLIKEQAIMHEFRSTGRVRNLELTLARKDGTPIEVSLNVSAIRNAEGKIVASRSVFRDITEQKRLEEAANIHMNQLAHLSRVATINEMATGIAHELNQPLHVIKNYAQGALIRLGTQSLGPVALKSILEDIVSDADRAAELIQSLRRYIKPSEKQTTCIEPTDLIARVARIVSGEIQQHDATLTIHAAKALPGISCDAVQIEQVLINLILNAAEAVSESDSTNRIITVRVESSQQRTVRFSVIDEGVGLAEVDSDRMFDTFYTTKTLGLGMGLSICRTIIEAHGGKLTAEANQGPGLTMSFELPVAVD